MKKAFFMFLLCVSCVMLSSCATIMTGRHQTIPVMTQPSGATATCGVQTIITPGELTLLRAGGPYIVTIKKDGYWQETVIIKKTLSGATAGNLILGGIIGIGVDAATGAMHKLTPEEINILLKPIPEPRPKEVAEGAKTEQAEAEEQQEPKTE